MRFAHCPQTIRLGDLEVRRLGFGAMRLPGPHVWGEPSDPATVHAVVRRAIELGVNFIDTAWYYGPWVANRVLVEALYPYPADLVFATKIGVDRGDDMSFRPALRPEQLRVAIDDDLRTLKLEQLPLVHLRWLPQADVSFTTALDVLIDAQRAGKIRHIGLSNVTVAQLDEALAKTPVVSVQNVFSAGRNDEGAEAVLAACEQRQIAFIPFSLPGVSPGARCNEPIAKRIGCTPPQLAIAYYLARSPMMLPIPGTSKVTHLEENVASVHCAIDAATLAQLSTCGPN
jgi:aryl-alcohol dehydrogenase-like predicted oxidoreductase